MLYILGMCYYRHAEQSLLYFERKGWLRKALKCFDKCFLVDGKNFLNSTYIARVHFDLGDVSKCAQFCEIALGANRHFEQTHALKALNLLRAGHLQEAFSAVKCGIREAGGSSPLLLVIRSYVEFTYEAAKADSVHWSADEEFGSESQEEKIRRSSNISNTSLRGQGGYREQNRNEDESIHFSPFESAKEREGESLGEMRSMKSPNSAGES